MQVLPEAEERSSEHAFATWYAYAREPGIAISERRLEDVLADIQYCERYLQRRERRWRVLDSVRRRVIGDTQTRLVQLRAEQRRIERTLGEGDAYAYGLRMFSRIRAIPRVTRVVCESGAMRVHTDRLYCYGPSGMDYRWYRLGMYTIDIGLEKTTQGWVRWRTSETQRPGNFLAPQIPASGAVTCFGEAATVQLRAALESMRYDTVVNVLVRFTECPSMMAGEMKGWPRIDAHDVPAWYRETPLQWHSS